MVKRRGDGAPSPKAGTTTRPPKADSLTPPPKAGTTTRPPRAGTASRPPKAGTVEDAPGAAVPLAPDSLPPSEPVAAGSDARFLNGRVLARATHGRPDPLEASPRTGLAGRIERAAAATRAWWRNMADLHELAADLSVGLEPPPVRAAGDGSPTASGRATAPPPAGRGAGTSVGPGAAEPDSAAAPPAAGPNLAAKIEVLALALALLAGTAALLAGPLASDAAIRHLGPQWAVALVVAAGFALAVAFPISVHSRGHTYLAVLSELPLLVGLVALGPVALVAASLAGEGAVLVGYRRQPPTKLVLNLARAAATSVLAVVVYRAALGTASPVAPAGWGAALAALGAAALLGQVVIVIAMRCYGQTARYHWWVELRTSVFLLVTNGALALVLLDAAWYSRLAVVPLVVVAILVVLAYRGYLRLVRRFATLQRLQAFGRSVASERLEQRATIETILSEATSVLRAAEAELWLPGSGRTLQAYRRLHDGTLEARRVALPETGPIAAALAGGEASRFALDDPESGADATRGRSGAPVALGLVAPLRLGSNEPGALLALGRTEALDPFDDDDLALFEALATQAGVALERARLFEELRTEALRKAHQASHDALTGLGNRAYYAELVGAGLAAHDHVAVAIFDLDRFKDVNDTLGHAVGDRLLVEIAQRLVTEAAGRASVVRLGGDEFGLVIAGVTGIEAALEVVRDLHTSIARPVQLEELALATSASCGVAISPGHGRDAATLLQRADAAMYLGKAAGSEVVCYDPARDVQTERRLALGGHLAQALEGAGQISLLFQPIVRLADGAVPRVEALARWVHPDLGAVPPDEFVAIAEHLGLVTRLTDVVLAQACAQAARWRQAGLALDVAVNLSVRDAVDRRLPDRVAAALSQSGLVAEALTLELTETAVMTDLEVARTILEQLAALGVELAIDDFGTGYSSLAYLHRLPVDELKIDRSFITNLGRDFGDGVIVASSIAMAHSLGLSVIAEGVEDTVSWEALAEAGCDFIQGYYLSKPLKAAELEHWLATRPAVPARELSERARIRRLDRPAARRTGPRRADPGRTPTGGVPVVPAAPAELPHARSDGGRRDVKGAAASPPPTGSDLA